MTRLWTYLPGEAEVPKPDPNLSVVLCLHNLKKSCPMLTFLGLAWSHLFCSAYGSEVGSAALKWIPTGGLYVSGGIIGKHLETIPHKYVGAGSPFMLAYRDKGRVSPILDSIPLFIVTAEDMGLRGARFSAMRVS